MGEGPARQGPLHLARNLGWPPVPTPGPQGFPGRSASAGLEDLLLGWSTGKRAVLWVAGRASIPWTAAQGPCEPDLTSQGWVTFPQGRFLEGGLPCPCLAAVLDRNQPGAAPTKAISWGPPPCSSIRKGGPLYGWKNRGIFAVGVTGRRGLRVCGHLGQLLTPRPQGSEPHGGRGPLIVGRRWPAWVKGRRGESPAREGACAQREPR